MPPNRFDDPHRHHPRRLRPRRGAALKASSTRSFFPPFATISRATPAATEPAIAATEPAIVAVGRDDVAAAVVTDAIGAVGVNRGDVAAIVAVGVNRGGVAIAHRLAAR
jgi:hypothetical protein